MHERATRGNPHTPHSAPPQISSLPPNTHTLTHPRTRAHARTRTHAHTHTHTHTHTSQLLPPWLHRHTVAHLSATSRVTAALFPCGTHQSAKVAFALGRTMGDATSRRGVLPCAPQVQPLSHSTHPHHRSSPRPTSTALRRHAPARQYRLGRARQWTRTAQGGDGAS